MKKTDKQVLRKWLVVKSRTGRDRKRVFIVTDIDYDDPISPVVIANGTLRKIEDRKHKNPAHLTPVGALVESEINELLNSFTNSKIAEICDKHDISQKKC